MFIIAHHFHQVVNYSSHSYTLTYTFPQILTPHTTSFFSSFQVTCKSVFELVDAHLDLTGEASSSRDGYFGRVFALASLIKSGRLVEEPALFKRVTRDLIVYMQKKHYLRECCCSLLCNVVQSVSLKTLKEHITSNLTELLNDPPSAESLAVAFALTTHAKDIRTLFPDQFSDESIFRQTWTEIFSDENSSILVEPFQQTAADLPSIHPVWAGFWELLAHEKGISLRAVWSHIIEQGAA